VCVFVVLYNAGGGVGVDGVPQIEACMLKICPALSYKQTLA
jgi:hypothetical protein